MNQKSLATFLCQALCLLIIIHLIGGLINIIGPITCERMVRHKNMIPLNVNATSKAYDVAKNSLLIFCSAIGCYTIGWSILGIFGITFLYSRQLINFAFGLGMLLQSLFALSESIALQWFLNSYYNIIFRPLATAFRAARVFTPEAELEYKKNQTEMFKAPYYDGWNSLAAGTKMDHNVIDFLQYNLGCCGWTGRYWWDISIPRSCCDDKYLGSNCVLDVAIPKSCILEYHNYLDCVRILRNSQFLFGLISIVTGITSLYLTRLQILHPDGEYKSETTSNTDSF